MGGENAIFLLFICNYLLQGVFGGYSESILHISYSCFQLWPNLNKTLDQQCLILLSYSPLSLTKKFLFIFQVNQSQLRSEELAQSLEHIFLRPLQSPRILCITPTASVELEFFPCFLLLAEGNLHFWIIVGLLLSFLFQLSVLPLKK